jgi:hypothetical protein
VTMPTQPLPWTFRLFICFGPVNSSAVIPSFRSWRRRRVSSVLRVFG